ncbi:MAG TPA: oligosaccharide flippase family protein [Bacteroidales bacterium]|nr:oligosaccharide flippase family protein [Bacteroidales bacterium]
MILDIYNLKSILLKSTFSRNSSIYILSSIISSGISFVLLTVLTHYLTKSDFGIIENFIAISTLFTSFMLWGGDISIINYYSEKHQKNVFSNAFIAIINQTIFLLLIVCILNFEILSINKWLLISGCLYAFMQATYSVITTSYQLEGKSLSYSITSVSLSILNSIITFFLVIYIHNYLSRIIGLISSSLIILIIIVFKFYRSKRFNTAISLSSIRNFYIVGFPLVIAQVASWLVERSDRVLVSKILSLDDLGVYGLGFQFGMIILVIQSAISRAWLPYIIEKVKIGQKRKLKKSIFLISLVLFIITVLISIFVFLYIRLFINPAFRDASWIAVIISLSYYFDGIWKLYNGILVYENNFRFYSMLIIISGICKVCLNIIFISHIGIMGAAITTLITFFFGFIINYWYVHYKLKWFEI